MGWGGGGGGGALPNIFLQCLSETVKARSHMYQFNICTFCFI